MISRRAGAGGASGGGRASSSSSTASSLGVALLSPSLAAAEAAAAASAAAASASASAGSVSPGSSSATSPGASQVPCNIDASKSRRRSTTRRRAGSAATSRQSQSRRVSSTNKELLVHVLTGLHESDDDDDVERDEDDAKTKKKRRQSHLKVLRRRLSRFFTPASSPRHVNDNRARCPTLLPRRRRATTGRSRDVVATKGILVLLVSMAVVATVLLTHSTQNAARYKDGWSVRLLTSLRGRRMIEASVGRGAEELLVPSQMVLPSLGRSAGRQRPRRPSTAYAAPIGNGGGADENRRREPDYGGLDIRILEEIGEARRIYKDWSLGEGKYDRSRPADDTNDYYYSLDDDDMRNTYRGWQDDTLHKTKRCRRTNWHRNVPVNCNSFHELDVPAAAHHGGFRLVGAGSYKHVFVVNTTSTSGVPEVVVFKNFGVAAQFDTKNYERMRKDVLVAERVGPHRLIVDVYGYCGLAQLDEAMPHGGLENVALPSPGQPRYGIKLRDEDHLVPRNSLLPSEKLALALDMFEAVALLHNYPGGVIVHDDIQLLQFLLTPDRKHVKLNDFNRMEVMLWDDHDKAYCRYRNGPGNGDWRSPEEFQDLPLDEKIDIFSLGNNLISVLTGRVPFYQAKGGFKEVQHLVTHGVRPPIDPRWKERSFAERKIVELIELCQAHDPGDRIDAGDAVTFLRDAVRTNALHHSHEDERVGARVAGS